MNVYQDVRERDFKRCRACGGTNALAVHHIVFRSQGGPNEPWNLITLCKGCHDLAHGLGGSRIERWHLQALLDFGLHNLAYMKMMLRSGDLQTCRSCRHRTEAFVCSLWEQTVTPDYGCDAWRVRSHTE